MKSENKSSHVAKSRDKYVCKNCNYLQSKWSWNCVNCDSDGSIEEVAVYSNKRASFNILTNIKTYKLSEACENQSFANTYIDTGITELNRVLGGGLVRGSVVLVGGEPGIGKSTLLLQMAAKLDNKNIPTVYISGEESVEQLTLRARRLSLTKSNLLLAAAYQLEEIIGLLKQQSEEGSCQMAVIDSIHTICSSEISSSVGSVAQLRYNVNMLVDFAKQNNVALFLVGHVTKDGQIAGPKTVEHMVDTVLYFEASDAARIIRTIKNRFGATGEVGAFAMNDTGLKELSNPSELYLPKMEFATSGSCIFAGIEGTRSILVEVQSLLSKTSLAIPRRAVVGWDSGRLAILIAVLNARCGINLDHIEAYLSMAGGLKVIEPAADLAVFMAIVSSFFKKIIPRRTAVFGEISLSGEIKGVSQAEKRIKEALNLGFNQIIASDIKSLSKKIKDIELIEVTTVQDVLSLIKRMQGEVLNDNK